MTISIDWVNKLVISTASLPDIVALKNELRDIEDDAEGMLHPAIITYKRIDLGGGAFFHAVDAINGYQLIFPNSGNYSVIGNFNIPIVPVPGVYVERVKAAAFAAVSGSESGGGGSAPTAEQIAQAVWDRQTQYHNTTGTYGAFVKTLMTVAKFIGLQK